MSGRVLIVEDDPVIRGYIEAFAGGLGLHTAAAPLIAEATEAAVAAADLVLLDVELPDGSGLELLREIRGRGLAVPVAVLTASTMDPAIGYERGATMWIRKPGDVEALDQSLRRAFSLLPDGDIVEELAERYPGGPQRFECLRTLIVESIQDARRELETPRLDAMQRIGHQLAVHAAMLRHPVAVDLRLLEAAAKTGRVDDETLYAVRAGLDDLLPRISSRIVG